MKDPRALLFLCILLSIQGLLEIRRNRGCWICNPMVQFGFSYTDSKLSIIPSFWEGSSPLSCTASSSFSICLKDGSFSEALYGLRRRAAEIKVTANNSQLELVDGIQHFRLEKVLLVVFMVLFPYLRSKLHSIYNKERDARLQATLWGDGGEGFGDVDLSSGGNPLISTRDLVNRIIS